MKKIYFTFLFLTTLSFGQNLIPNGDFETWTDSTTPASWTVAENTEQETTEIHGGANAAKHTGGTKKISQLIPGIIAGKTYTISMWYKVASGDGTDARIWSYWKDAADVNITDANTDGALRGPNNAYFNNNGNVWTEYTATVVAPANAEKILFEVRTYSGAVTYWDDFSMVCDDCGSDPVLSIVSPANNTMYNPTVSDVSITLNISNFVVAPIGGGGDGHIHYTVNAMMQPMKYDTDPIALTGLSAGTHTVYIELVDNAHQPIVPAVNTTLTFEIGAYTPAANIAAVRADVLANGAGKYYDIAGEALVTYTRANRNQKYIQDTTAGILIDDVAGTITNTFAIGDGMTGLKGQASYYAGVLQIVPIADIASSSTGNTITPEVVTIADINANQENYESELVKVVGATFADGNGTNVFATSTDYSIDDTNAMIFRTLFSEADYIGQAIPSGATDIIGLVSEFNATNQIVARSLADFAPTASIATQTIAGLQVYPNPVNGTELTIVTSNNANIEVSVFDMLGKEVVNTTVLNNKVNIANLTSGIYIVKITEENKTATQKLVVE